jgi:hypothetical protein
MRYTTDRFGNAAFDHGLGAPKTPEHWCDEQATPGKEVGEVSPDGRCCIRAGHYETSSRGDSTFVGGGDNIECFDIPSADRRGEAAPRDAGGGSSRASVIQDTFYAPQASFNAGLFGSRHRALGIRGGFAAVGVDACTGGNYAACKAGCGSNDSYCVSQCAVNCSDAPFSSASLDGGLGLVVRPSWGWQQSYSFRPWGWQAPYQYYQPAYAYQDAACPVALALTAEQTAALRAGQAIVVSAPNNCGQIVQVTVRGAPLPPIPPPGGSAISGLGGALGQVPAPGLGIAGVAATLAATAAGALLGGFFGAGVFGARP